MEFKGNKRYDMRGRIGAGGMGVVYRVYDSVRRQEVALKTLRGMAPAAIYRFKREFRALAGVVHPNLVQLYELGAHESQWYFTMELVDGVEFLDWVRPKRVLDEVRLRETLSQLTRALRALHEAGKLHRDLKPSNIMVTDAGRCVLLDFGLVAELNPAQINKRSNARLAGTAVYMPPEAGDSASIGRPSDWYSYGVMLYEALTGQRPFDGGLVEVMQQKRSEDPAHPNELAAGLPPDLTDLCMQLLSRNPSARPRAADVLAVLGDRRPGSRVRSRQKTRSSDPFVGREAETALLLQALDDDSRPGLLELTGPMGWGKTRLVRTVVAARGDTTLALVGQCSEREEVPFRAVDGVMDALASTLVNISGTVQWPDVHVLAAQFPVLYRAPCVRKAPRPALDLEPAASMRRSAVALRRLLRVAAGDRRPVLILDDVHWGDTDSARLIAELLVAPTLPPLAAAASQTGPIVIPESPRTSDTHSTIEDLPRIPLSDVTDPLDPGRIPQNTAPTIPTGVGEPALVIIIHRGGDSPFLAELRARLPEANSGLGPRRSHLALESLSHAECAEMAQALLGGVTQTSRSLATNIADEADGSPRQVKELARHALLGGWRDTSTPTVDSLRLAIQRRVEALDGHSRRLLEVLVLAGRPMWPEVVLDAAGQAGHAELVSVLVGARLARQRDGRLEVHHETVRDVTLEATPIELHASLHSDIAQAYLRTGDSDPAALVAHFQGCGDAEGATRFAVVAARRAARAGAFEQAVAFFRLAVDLDPGTVDRAEVFTELGHALIARRRPQEAAESYGWAADALGETTDAGAAALCAAATQHLRSGNMEAGKAALARVFVWLGGEPTAGRILWARLRIRGYVPASRQPQTARDRIRLDALWAGAHGLVFTDPARASQLHLNHLLLALELGDRRHCARALAMEAVFAYLGGRGPAASGHLIAAERLARELDDAPALLLAVVAAAAVSLGAWRLPAALTLAEDAAALAEQRCPDAGWELITADGLAVGALTLMGNLGEATRRAEHRLALSGSDQHARHLMAAMRSLSPVARWEPPSETEGVFWVLGLIGRVGALLWQDKPRDAFQLMEDSRRTFKTALKLSATRRLLDDLRGRCAVAAAAVGEKDALTVAARAAKALADDDESPASEGLALMLEAQIDHLRGRDARSHAAWDKAEGILRNAGLELHATVVAWHRGLAAESREWMMSHGISDPAHVVRVLAPGVRAI